MKWLIFTTTDDRCESYFASAGHKIHYYDDVIKYLPKDISTVYFRDPFNTGHYDMKLIENVMKIVNGHYPDAYYVDECRTIDDVMIEDKWRQYQLLAEFMPETWLASGNDDHETNVIVKERISSRARGILFSIGDVPMSRRDEFIVQPLLDIEREYRVYTIRSEVMALMTQKSSKTIDTKVKIMNFMPVTDDIKQFVEKIIKRLPVQYDLLGFDIVYIADALMLVEINRSPQFKRYNELTGMNILQMMIDKIEETA